MGPRGPCDYFPERGRREGGVQPRAQSKAAQLDAPKSTWPKPALPRTVRRSLARDTPWGASVSP